MVIFDIILFYFILFRSFLFQLFNVIFFARKLFSPQFLVCIHLELMKRRAIGDMKTVIWPMNITTDLLQTDEKSPSLKCDKFYRICSNV